MNFAYRVIPIIAAVSLLLVACGGGGDGGGGGPLFDISRVSVDSAGIEGNDISSNSSISGDGRYVAFSSNATNLVVGDANGKRDVFIRDNVTSTTNRISVDSAGIEGNNISSNPSISGDGRYVAFSSNATNLVVGDTNGSADIFVHDTVTSTTTRVSVDSAGVEGNGHSISPNISGDGRYVAFQSFANNLVAGDINGFSDIFVHDTVTAVTTRVSVDSSGIQALLNDSFSPSISNDGRYVAFESKASNLVSGDTNGTEDIFVHDTVASTTTRVSVDSAGIEGNNSSFRPSISGDGRYVAFDSRASNLVAGDTNLSRDVFVHDTVTLTTSRVSVNSAGDQAGATANDQTARISGDGRYVAFQSNANNLVAGDANMTYDIFVHDTVSSTTTRVSVDSTGIEGNGDSTSPSISNDGRYVAFHSVATNLVSGDTNGTSDVFRVTK